MTADDAEEAIERAKDQFFDSDLASHEFYFQWEWLNVLSNIGTPPVVEERYGYDLVMCSENRLVPVLQGNVGTFEIYDDEKGSRLIERSCDGDDVADAVLCSVAARFIDSGCAMPDHLRDYIVDKMTHHVQTPPRRRRGRFDPYQNFSRDFSIASAVLALKRGGVKPTRNEATRKDCGCSIVSRAVQEIGIDLSEHAVAKIWGKFKKQFEAELDGHECGTDP